MSARTCRWLSGLFAVALSGAADAATFDLNRLFDAGRDAVTAATGVEEKEEIEIGREVAGRTLGAAPLVNDPELQTYVNRVGRWLASQSERQDLPWRFGVVDTPSVNAFAAPGGFVLVTRGLYEMLDNEAQLAAVLGHEIAHILQRHHITVMRKSAALSAGARLAQREGRSALVNSMIGNGAEVFARGLDKSAEFEADHIGIVIAARAGYNPYALLDVLHKLSARGREDGSLALLFKTHPTPAERLAQLGEMLAPRMAQLPDGREPPIRATRADLPLSTEQPVAAPAGTRTLQPAAGDAAAPPSTGGGFDPGSLLRGLIRR